MTTYTMRPCTCIADKEMTCIVHPTTRSLKDLIAQLEAENAKLQADIERGTNHNLELLDEVAALKEAALLYSSDIGHSHACKATSKTVGVCICGYDALAALLEGNGCKNGGERDGKG